MHVLTYGRIAQKLNSRIKLILENEFETLFVCLNFGVPYLYPRGSKKKNHYP